jgi:IS1 family transposase
MTGASKNTIAKLLIELGIACLEYMDKTLVNLPCNLIQVDEIWSFVGAKQKNLTPANIEGGAMGDVWTWIAIDAETKLIPCFSVGARDAHTAQRFIADLAGRLANRVQLTSDGLRLYVKAVDRAFSGDIDYAMLIKVYGGTSEGEKRYSPAECVGCERVRVMGGPDPRYISTSYIERQNLTVRMQNRRFTRLTNAFSKKLDNHIASLAIHYMHYNFVRIHQTLRMTPAMAAGVTAHLWDVEDLVALIQ